jgi:hypothetical protein
MGAATYRLDFHASDGLRPHGRPYLVNHHTPEPLDALTTHLTLKNVVVQRDGPYGRIVWLTSRPPHDEQVTAALRRRFDQMPGWDAATHHWSVSCECATTEEAKDLVVSLRALLDRGLPAFPPVRQRARRERAG